MLYEELPNDTYECLVFNYQIGSNMFSHFAGPVPAYGLAEISAEKERGEFKSREAKFATLMSHSFFQRTSDPYKSNLRNRTVVH